MIAKMTYNTKQKRLNLSEYGRHIQNMVNHCVSISDREERTKHANTIINIMGNMFPHLRDVNDFKHILWDHLAIMSDFSLDIDYPYEIIKKENLYIKPQKLPYPQNSTINKHYGKNIERMILKIAEYKENAKREYLINLLIIHMKRSLLAWNKEELEEHKIFEDIKQFSKGSIVLDENSYKLNNFKKDIPLFKKKKNNNHFVHQQKSKKK